MKKLLGISLVAVLTATPLMASAADRVPLVTPEPTPNTNVASTSYVQGAYNVLGKAINAIDTDLSGNYATKEELSAETNARTNADTTLQNNIDTLSSTVATKAAQADLEAEVTARTTADTALQTAINTKANSADVYTKTEADARFDATGAAATAETNAKAYADAKVLNVYTTWGSETPTPTKLSNPAANPAA